MKDVLVVASGRRALALPERVELMADARWVRGRGLGRSVRMLVATGLISTRPSLTPAAHARAWGMANGSAAPTRQLALDLALLAPTLELGSWRDRLALDVRSSAIARRLANCPAAAHAQPPDLSLARLDQREKLASTIYALAERQPPGVPLTLEFLSRDQAARRLGAAFPAASFDADAPVIVLDAPGDTTVVRQFGGTSSEIGRWAACCVTRQGEAFEADLTQLALPPDNAQSSIAVQTLAPHAQLVIGVASDVVYCTASGEVVRQGGGIQVLMSTTPASSRVYRRREPDAREPRGGGGIAPLRVKSTVLSPDGSERVQIITYDPISLRTRPSAARSRSMTRAPAARATWAA